MQKMLFLAAAATADGVKAVLVQGTHRRRPVASSRDTEASALARIEFCVRCDDPHDQGSLVHGLTAVQGPRDYRVNGTLAYAVPNDARKPLANADETRDTIVLCDRGTVPLVQKVLAIQAVGARAAVLVDDGQCAPDLECRRVGAPSLGGFAPKDDPEAWRKVTIPAILVSADTGARLRRLMHLDRKHLPTLGFQFLNRRPRTNEL